MNTSANLPPVLSRRTVFPLATGVAALTALLSVSPVHGALVTYSADAYTTYLFHFDEVAGGSSAANSGTAGGNVLAYSANAYPGDSIAAPAVTTVLGATAFTGFGLAANLNPGGVTTNATAAAANGVGLGYDVDASGTFVLDDTAPLSTDRLANQNSILSTTGFTLEAMINVSAVSGVGTQEIISTDNAGGAAARGFQFRLNATGNLEFFDIGAGAGAVAANDKVSSISVTDASLGSNAFVANAWFHAAVTFDGSSLKFYWTKVDGANTQANLLGTSLAFTNAQIDLTDTGFLVLGNEGRVNGTAASQEGLLGSLDEVRISSIARTAGQFIFAPASVSFWNLDANGNWDTPTNWTAGVPNAVSAAANFGGGGTAITTNRTVTLNGTKTVGTITFDNPAASFTLVSGTNGALALDNGASAANVTVASGTHTIAVPISIPAVGATFTVGNTADRLILTNAVTGTGPFMKSGAGTVEIGSGGTSGSLPSGNIVISAGSLAINRSDNVVLAQNFSGAGALAQNSAATLTLTGTNTVGGIIVNAGTVVAGSATALPASVALTVNAGTLNLNGQTAVAASLAGTGAGVLTDASAGAGTNTLTVSGTTATDFFGSINNGVAKVMALLKAGTGTTRLRGPSNFSGGTTLNQGFLELYSNTALGTAAIVINPSTTVAAANNTRLTLGDGVTFSNPITLSVVQPGAATGALQALGADFATFAGPITINSNALSGGAILGPASGLLSFTAPITAGGSVTTVIVRGGNVRFSGGGSYPQLRVDAGTTSIGADNGISPGTVIELAANAGTGTPATIDLNGFNQRLAGLQNALTPANAALITNNGATTSTLTFDAGAGNSHSYGGSIGGDLRVVNASGTQELSATGAFGLNGFYTYSGSTNISGGKLIVSAGLSGTSTVSIASGAALAGSSTVTTVDGNVTVASAGILEPGNGTTGNIGTLDFALGLGTLNLSAAAGGTGYLKLDLDAPLASDAIKVSAGTLNIGTGLDLDDFAFNLLAGFTAGTYTLFDTGSSIVGTLGTHLTGQLGGLSVTLQFANGGANRDDLVLIAVPEPGSAAMLLSTVGGVLGFRRRRNS